MLQFWCLCLVHVLLFCCSHLGVWHLALWGFQGWRNYPLRNGSGQDSPPPPPLYRQLLHNIGMTENDWINQSDCTIAVSGVLAS